MFNKLYVSIKNYIKDNYKILIVFLLIFLFFTIKLPFYVSAPGGILDTSNKIDIASDFKLKGSLNMAYVSQMDGNIPILLYSLVNPNWDIEKEKDITVGDESVADLEYRNKMLMEEANDIALLVAYDYTKTPYTLFNNKVFVTYIDEEAKTNLRVGDQILKVDGNEVTNKKFLFDYIKTKTPKEKIKFMVLRDGKEKECYSTLINVSGDTKVGIIITEDVTIKSDAHVSLKFKDTESGSSGGMMMALSIYSYLNKKDLTSGKKIVGTGTIDREGNVGEISGVKYKLIGAVKADSDIFLVPQGENYVEARNLKNKKGYDIDIVPVETFDDVLKYLSQ